MAGCYSIRTRRDVRLGVRSRLETRREAGLQPGALLHYLISYRWWEPAFEVEVGSPDKAQASGGPNKVVIWEDAGSGVSMGLTTGTARIEEQYNTRMRTPMIGNRMCAIALSAASAIICSAPPAIAAQFDGNWSMVAETTRGHCGNIGIGLGINRGRIYSTGGSFAFYPIQLGGRVSASGHVWMNAVAGPRTAHGTGRFGQVRGSGTWAGRGPSGLCSGVWSANRS